MVCCSGVMMLNIICWIWLDDSGGKPGIACMSPFFLIIGGSPAVRWRSDDLYSISFSRRSSSISC